MGPILGKCILYRCKKCDYFGAIVFIKLIANSYWLPTNVSIVSDVKHYHQNKYTVSLMLKVVGAGSHDEDGPDAGS